MGYNESLARKEGSKLIIIKAVLSALIAVVVLQTRGAVNIISTVLFTYLVISAIAFISSIFKHWILSLIVIAVLFFVGTSGKIPSSMLFIGVTVFAVVGVIFDVLRIVKPNLYLKFVSTEPIPEEMRIAVAKAMENDEYNRTVIAINNKLSTFMEKFQQVTDLMDGIRTDKDDAMMISYLEEYEALKRQMQSSEANGQKTVEQVKQFYASLDNLEQRVLGYGAKLKERQEKAEFESEFFNGCDNMESLTKRYRDLVKVYHPDQGNGSPEIFSKIQSDYDTLSKKYS